MSDREINAGWTLGPSCDGVVISHKAASYRDGFCQLLLTYSEVQRLQKIFNQLEQERSEAFSEIWVEKE